MFLCNDQSHAKISLIVMQDLSMPLLTPHVLFHPHSLMGDAPCMWDASSVRWHSTFSQRDLSIRQEVSGHISLTCAHFCVGCNTVPMNVPQKIIVVKSRKCDTIPKIPRLDERAPGNGNFYLTRFSCVVLKLWALTILFDFLGLACFILCTYNPKFEFALATT